MKNAKSAAALAAATQASGTHRESTESDRSREIMSSALQLFAERGFADVTIKDIAGRLGINTALIYYYFKNKEDLFRACLEAAVYDAMASYDSIRGAADHPVDRINSWFDSNITLSGSISNMVKVMLDYTGSNLRLPSVDRLIRRFYEEECRLLAKAFGEGTAMGVFNSVDNEALAQFVSTHLDGIMVAAIIRPGFNIPESVTTLRALLFHRLGYEPGPLTRRRHRRTNSSRIN
jgi:AcrR family transcriptional regulator